MMHYQEIMLQVMKKIAENTGRIADSLEKMEKQNAEMKKNPHGDYQMFADDILEYIKNINEKMGKEE